MTKEKKKEKGKGGRPSIYEQHWSSKEALERIRGWARDGTTTSADIAERMGIGVSTLCEWQNKYPEFAAALKENKEVVDRKVESSLLKRALGYEYDEVTCEKGVETKRVTKQVVPDVTAQIFWLKNRKPDDWRDKTNVEHTGKDGGVIEVHEMTTEEMDARILELQAKLGGVVKNGQE